MNNAEFFRLFILNILSITMCVPKFAEKRNSIISTNNNSQLTTHNSRLSRFGDKPVA